MKLLFTACFLSVPVPEDFLPRDGYFRSMPLSLRFAKQRLLLGDTWQGRPDDDRMFIGNGAPIFPTAPIQWYHKFIGRSGLPPVSIHSLRHTYASLMIADDQIRTGDLILTKVSVSSV